MAITLVPSAQVELHGTAGLHASVPLQSFVRASLAARAREAHAMRVVSQQACSSQNQGRIGPSSQAAAPAAAAAAAAAAGVADPSLAAAVVAAAG
eukprot:scaffold52702_cov14-Tisochrysis_lutea.AAC.1